MMNQPFSKINIMRILTYSIFIPLIFIQCREFDYKSVNDVKEINIVGFCVNLSKNYGYVINDDSTYMSLLISNPQQDLCKTYELPVIDFSQKTLLGKHAFGSGCSINFKRQVIVSDKEKKCIYIIKVKERGGCLMLNSSWNWITIPKVPFDYSIIFEVKKY